MISGFSGIYQLECDICGQEAGEEFDSFMDAVEYKKIEVMDGQVEK